VPQDAIEGIIDVVERGDELVAPVFLFGHGSTLTLPRAFFFCAPVPVRPPEGFENASTGAGPGRTLHPNSRLRGELRAHRGAPGTDLAAVRKAVLYPAELRAPTAAHGSGRRRHLHPNVGRGARRVGRCDSLAAVPRRCAVFVQARV